MTEYDESIVKNLETIHSFVVSDEPQKLYVYIGYYGTDFYKDYKVFLDKNCNIQDCYDYFTYALLVYQKIARKRRG
jgi:hypothetical protein